MYLLNTKASPAHVEPVCDMDMSSRCEVKNGVLTSLSAGMGSTNVASSKNLERNKNVSNCATSSCCTSHHQLSPNRSWPNKSPLASSLLLVLKPPTRSRTMEPAWCASVLHLETTSGMLKVIQNWRFLEGSWHSTKLWFDANKPEPTNRVAQYGISMHIIYHHIQSSDQIIKPIWAWLEEQVKTLCWHRPQVMHLPTVHTNYI